MEISSKEIQIEDRERKQITTAEIKEECFDTIGESAKYCY